MGEELRVTVIPKNYSLIESLLTKFIGKTTIFKSDEATNLSILTDVLYDNDGITLKFEYGGIEKLIKSTVGEIVGVYNDVLNIYHGISMMQVIPTVEYFHFVRRDIR